MRIKTHCEHVLQYCWYDVGMMSLWETGARCWAEHWSGWPACCWSPRTAGCWAEWCSSCTDHQNCAGVETRTCILLLLLLLLLDLLHLLLNLHLRLRLRPTSSWASWRGDDPGPPPAPHSRLSSERMRWWTHSDSRPLGDWRPGCWPTWGRSWGRGPGRRTGRRWSSRWRRRPGSAWWTGSRPACSWCGCGTHCRHWGTWGGPHSELQILETGDCSNSHSGISEQCRTESWVRLCLARGRLGLLLTRPVLVTDVEPQSAHQQYFSWIQTKTNKTIKPMWARRGGIIR